MSLCLLVPGERFELPTNGLQNRCSTTELTRQINDLQDRSEAWLQLVAVSSRNSRPAPLEPHLCLRRPGKCPPLSARPREGHPATHSASQTRVNALLPSRGRRCGDPAWPWIPAFAGMSGVCCTVGASHFKRECLRLPRCLRDFMRPRRAPAVKNFLYERNLSRGRALCWWNELYDPLSSFVPVLEPRPRRGFSFGLDARERSRNRSHVVGRPPSIVGSWIPQPGSAGFMPCGRGRGGMEFATCPLASSWHCPAGPFDRASRDAPARRRPRSAGRLRGLDV